jgi:hypothetical protein
MKHATEMGSGATKCIPSFINIGSGIQNWIGDTVIMDTITIVLRRFNTKTFLISAQ